MQINEGKFLQNGKCGYVLKPNFMLKNSDCNLVFPSTEEDPVIVVVKVMLNETKPTRNFHKWFDVQVIAARHLTKSKRGIVSPCVEIEIIGSQLDTVSSNKHTTKIISKEDAYNSEVHIM